MVRARATSAGWTPPGPLVGASSAFSRASSERNVAASSPAAACSRRYAMARSATLASRPRGTHWS
eukprot:3891683-Lingulodinium_polyedra.AAC.1